ncbi:MAG TPA: hypothetical protein PKB07_01770 [Flavilitoribacter sp.]|nr:hypothetical protein [Flavilitoribacter sp.]
MHFPGIKLTLLIMLAASGLMAQEPCLDNLGIKISYFGMDGFFVREIKGQKTFLNFAGMNVGCFAGGVLDDKNNCQYQSFGKFDFDSNSKVLTMLEEEKSLSFKVEFIDCRTLILLPISDNGSSGKALTFSRDDAFPGKFNRCFEICSKAFGPCIAYLFIKGYFRVILAPWIKRDLTQIGKYIWDQFDLINKKR